MSVKIRNYFFLVLNILIPLLIGTLIYLLFDPNVYVTKYMIELVGYDFTIYNLVYQYEGIKLLRNYGCDALWAYSLFFTIASVLGNEKKNIIAAFCISFVFELIMEILQLISVLRGAFDILDIFVEVLFNMIAILIFLKMRRKIKNEKEI